MGTAATTDNIANFFRCLQTIVVFFRLLFRAKEKRWTSSTFINKKEDSLFSSTWHQIVTFYWHFFFRVNYVNSNPVEINERFDAFASAHLQEQLGRFQHYGLSFATFSVHVQTR